MSMCSGTRSMLIYPLGEHSRHSLVSILSMLLYVTSWLSQLNTKLGGAQAAELWSKSAGTLRWKINPLQ